MNLRENLVSVSNRAGNAEPSLERSTLSAMLAGLEFCTVLNHSDFGMRGNPDCISPRHVNIGRPHPHADDAGWSNFVPPWLQRKDVDGFRVLMPQNETSTKTITTDMQHHKFNDLCNYRLRLSHCIRTLFWALLTFILYTRSAPNLALAKRV